MSPAKGQYSCPHEPLPCPTYCLPDAKPARCNKQAASDKWPDAPCTPENTCWSDRPCPAHGGNVESVKGIFDCECPAFQGRTLHSNGCKYQEAS